jgi:hypothetical protein
MGGSSSTYGGEQERILGYWWIILGWILERWDGESCCEFGIEPSGSMKCWETIEWPNI